MNDWENRIRTVRFERPEWIPMTFHINDACWNHFDRNALMDLMENHPLLFPGFDRSQKVFPPVYDLDARSDAPYTDPWGCVWETMEDGITGSVTRHPLADWENFSGYVSPDPEKTTGMFPVNWDQLRSGDFKKVELPHGHTFLRLLYIRGYENLVLDMAMGEPRLGELLERVEGFNAKVVRQFIEAGAEWIGYPEDLGMQRGPMLSPSHFRGYIRPVYERLMQPARDAGCIVHMHSDGDIRDLANDLLAGGVDALNLQDLVNGLDWIKENLSGKVCVDLDIDRQSVTRFGSPKDIDTLIRREVESLGCREGGLMMIYGLYPGVPLENAAALMDAMEKYMGYFT
jgi:hypothetical protein